MNSPYRVHPALPSSDSKTVPFPAAVVRNAPPVVPNRLQQLLKIEGDIRQLPSWAATVFHALNETQGLLGQQQAFFFRANNRDRLQCEGASAIAQLDARAPLVTAFEGLIKRLDDPAQLQKLDMAAAWPQSRYPHRFALWLPLKDGKAKAFAGLLLLRDDPWTEDLGVLGARLAEAYAHALRVQRPPQLLRQLSMPRHVVWMAPLFIALVAAIPVPLTTLAPFEVVPRAPMPVSVGIDGVIKSIAIDPNQPVAKGQLIMTLDDTALAAERDISLQRVTVAETRLATARSAAFADADSKRTLATLEKEFALAEAEHALAVARVNRTRIAAEASGLLVYASRNDWVGKPVRIGEKVMEIADVGDVAVRVDVGVHDSVALPGSETLRLFLDADPLHPRHAVITEKSFHAAERTSGQLTYTVKGTFDAEGEPPRIGMRGTAQLIGPRVSLGFYVLRRPLAALRQQVGL